MKFSLILENSTGEQIDLTTTANRYMVSEIDGLYPPNGTISTSTYANVDVKYKNSRTVNQTNNSPKALSRLDIYRLTRNAVKQ